MPQLSPNVYMEWQIFNRTWRQMSEEFRKLQERNKRIIEIIKHKNDLVADLQKEISELTAERQANDLNLAALNYEGDSDNT